MSVKNQAKYIYSLSVVLMIFIVSILTTAFGSEITGRTYELYDIQFKTDRLGLYQVTIESHERPSHETLSFISSSYFPYSTLSDQTEVDNTAPEARYHAQGITKVDVVFATGELSQSSQMQDYMDTFESNLQSASNFIDAYVEKVETSTISSNDAGAAEIFNNWTNYPDNTGQWTFNASDNSMGSTRNVSWTGFWNDKDQQATDLVIEYKSKEVIRQADIGSLDYPNANCHPDPMGWTFRMTYENGKYSYYAFCIYAYQGIAILARINGTPNPNQATNGVVTGWTSTIPNTVGQTNGYVTQLAYTKIDYNPLTEHSVKLEITGNNIKVNYDGRQIFDYTDNSSQALTHGGYGPFTYSMPNANFYDIVITTGANKTLGEAISDVAWRDGSLRFVIHATDIIPLECETGNDDEFAYTVTKLLNSNCYLINLGNNINIMQLNRLVEAIKESDGTSKGTFFYNNRPNIITAMNQSADYIIDLAQNLVKPVDWVLVNTEILWNTTYNDQENDPPLNLGEHNGQYEQPQDTSDITLAQSYGLGDAGRTRAYNGSKLLAEKWRYRHYNDFFDNSPVQVSWHEVWIENPVSIFEYPGKYRINYKRRDNPLYPSVNLNDAFDSYRYWSTNYDYLTSSE